MRKNSKTVFIVALSLIILETNASAFYIKNNFTDKINPIQQEGQNEYPIDPITGKIAYIGNGTLEVSKQRLYKRAEQFIISQNFDRVENITCKDRKSIELQLVNDPISFEDAEDGVHIGNGFFNYKYRGHNWFVVTFNYKIAVKENKYSYRVYNFKILEFITADKNFTKGKGSAAAVGISVGNIGGAAAKHKHSGETEFSSKFVKQFPLEEFIIQHSNDQATFDFLRNIEIFTKQLRATLSDDF